MQNAVFPPNFRKFPQNFHKMLEKYSNSKVHPDVPIYLKYIIYFAVERAFHWLSFAVLDPYERFSGFSVF